MARRRKTLRPKLWTIVEIEKLRAAKACGMCTKDIAAMFQGRSYLSVTYAIGKYCEYEKSGNRYPPEKRKRYNPNTPTMLTYILVHNYYDEDIRCGMTRDATIADIAEALNRSPKWVEKALKTDVRKYVEKDESDSDES